MSVLHGKHILVIGEETEQITEIEAALITYGATITTTTCKTTAADTAALHAADLVLINHLHEGKHCTQLIESLNDGSQNFVPILTLVKNDQLHIKEAFVLGAADYITKKEDVHLVIEKIKSILGGLDGLEKSAIAIDITPPPTTPQSNKTKVFVIEDDPLLHNLLSIYFEKAGLPLEIVKDGSNVIADVRTFNPDVIMLDLMLPGKDGFTILKELKEADTKNIPVVIFSNNDNPADRERAENMGAEAFYVKALTDLSELVPIIQEFSKNRVV